MTMGVCRVWGANESADTRNAANASAFGLRDMSRFLRVFCRILLGHVRHDESHIFIGNHGANSHVALDRDHHPRRQFVVCAVAAAAVSAKSPLSLETRVRRVMH